MQFIILFSTLQMQEEPISSVEMEYDQCIKRVNELSEHIKILSNEHQLQNLEEVALPDQYLTLLANSIYAVNSLAYSYSNIKNTPLPPEFSKVQELYKMAKNPLAGQPVPSKPSLVINKEAAGRVIQHALK